MTRTQAGQRAKPAPAEAALALELGDLRAEVGELREACRLKDQYLSVAAHELSAPLAAIKAYVEALRDHHDDPDFGQTAEFLAVLERETDRLIRLVERTLEISRLTWRGTRVQREPTQLAELIAEIVPAVQPALEERAATLALDVDCDLPAVEVDRDLVKQVLLNLIHNALKFSPPGTTVTVGAAFAASGVQVEVRDQGYGIAPDELGRVFDPYFRSADRRVERERGTGLGLSIVKTIVQQHGGRVAVESQPDCGTTFRFTLPID